jgi:hypothetical protein
MDRGARAHRQSACASRAALTQHDRTADVSWEEGGGPALAQGTRNRSDTADD